MTNDRVALVSGGSKGLGAAVVADLLSRGTRVAAFSRRESPFVKGLRAEDPEGQRFHWAPVDAADPVEIQAFVQDSARRFGHLDSLVACAGIGTEGMLTLMTSDQIDELLAVNLGGAIHLTRAFVKQLFARRRGGEIVHVSSINGIRGHAGIGVYSATKAALDGLTRSLAKELGAKRIRVNAIAPGYFDSDMVVGLSEEARGRIAKRTPLGRLGTVDDMVCAIRFLLSEDARFITGQTLVVDGGLTC